ncbi:hypothetical protein V6N13_005284 [Hibiscus sabdariffa]
MGLFFGFYLILVLNPILQAAAAAGYQQGICGEEVCGNVTFPPPFGIHHNCYNLSWFRVTCKGNKPFINIKGINLEVLGSYSLTSINVNYPVTPINCNRKLDITRADVDLAGTPFFLSGYYNYFGSVGCGNLATISTNSTDSIGGCVQPKCGRKAGGSGSGCYTEIIGKLTSYTVSMADMYGSKRSCVSAFMFISSYFDDGYPLPVEINSETTHVPVTLEWDSSYCGESGCVAPGPVNLFSQTTCGKVDFEYPFGVRNQQDSKSRFEVDCIETTNGEQTPFLNINGIDLQILEFSFLDGTVVVNHSVTYFSCRGSNNNGTSLNLEGTPFYYDIHNIFWSSGCGNLVTLFDKRDGNFIGGCSQPSCRIRNETSSSAGCRIFFPPGLNSFFANISGVVGSSDYSSKRSCGFASPVYSGVYGSFLSSPKDFNISDLSYVPMSLKWGAPKRGSCQLNQGSAISCSSDGKYCWKSLNTSHLCVCTAKNIIDLGTNCQGMYCGEYRWCHILCLNTRDNYCLSPALPTRKTLNFKLIMIGCITSVVSISLLIVVWQIYKAFRKRQNIKLKQKYFKRNGGLLLQKHLSGNQGNVEKIKLFTSKEMEKATDHYNKNRILGQGGQGTVYKGMLTDGNIVAVKKSRMLEGNRFDEKKVEQFINEVMILSQINHRNVVKLLGCCLEAEVPLLVYEFIQNGTLYDLIHYQTEEFPLTWDMRLRIAIEIANALFYLHSAASISIYHRDIKSSNILLDDKTEAHTAGSIRRGEKLDILLPAFNAGGSLFGILDSTIVNDSPMEEITAMAKLARRCLNLNGKKRPTMKQVAMELELIRASEAGVAIEECSDEESETDEIIESWNANLSWLTSISITTESTTLPLNATF